MPIKVRSIANSHESENTINNKIKIDILPALKREVFSSILRNICASQLAVLLNQCRASIKRAQTTISDTGQRRRGEFDCGLWWSQQYRRQ
jgi:hypothetical protein